MHFNKSLPLGWLWKSSCKVHIKKSCPVASAGRSHCIYALIASREHKLQPCFLSQKWVEELQHGYCWGAGKTCPRPKNWGSMECAAHFYNIYIAFQPKIPCLQGFFTIFCRKTLTMTSKQWRIVTNPQQNKSVSTSLPKGDQEKHFSAFPEGEAPQNSSA